MNNLTKKDLINLHKLIQEQSKETMPGIKDKGLLDSIPERPDLILYRKELYPDIYLKSASIMEGIIRLHPFVDGNKRTGLIATQTYLQINGYIPLFPTNAVRFAIIIAKTKAEEEGKEQETTDKLIIEISEWLKKYVAKYNDIKKYKKIMFNIRSELANIEKLITDNPEKAEKIMDEWLAIDIYPEYKFNAIELLNFIRSINIQSLDSLMQYLTDKISSYKKNYKNNN